MSKALARRKKNPIAKRNPAFTYTKAALIGAVVGGTAAAITYYDVPTPPSRVRTAIDGAVKGAVVLTVAALLYREYKVYGV